RVVDRPVRPPSGTVPPGRRAHSHHDYDTTHTIGGIRPDQGRCSGSLCGTPARGVSMTQNNRTRRRAMAAASGFAALALALSACGGDDSTDDAVADATSAVASAATEATSAVGSAASKATSAVA